MGDLLRGGAAFGVALFLLLIAKVGSFGFFGALVLVVLFGFYLAATAARYWSVIEIDDTGIRRRGGLFPAAAIKWAELERFELRHFPLSRDRKEGWMDLKLRGSGKQTILIDDRIDGFGQVLARAWAGARVAEVGISEATHANLIAAGLVPKSGH
jgi:uncharacterized membrane protein